MSNPNTDRNLLTGILALQLDFISRDALIQAMNAWVLEKAKPLSQILLEQGALATDARDLLDALVQKHLALHGNDAEMSLAAVSSLKSVRQELEQIVDPDLHHSLAHVSQARRAELDPWATASSVGTPTSFGLRFRILRPHASGGLGQVSVAHDEELHREVALKEIQNRYADDPSSRNRFLQEAEITGGLEHPGIVPVYGLGTYADGRPYYAMRFIRGDSLKDALNQFHQAEVPGRGPGERTLALRALLRRFVDVCNAVAYAHARGVLHRDLKPGNVMLGKYGETLVVDWGLAKAGVAAEGVTGAAESLLKPASGDNSSRTQMGQVLGTPQFMAPEQAAGRLDELGPSSDVYSLGATLYCLLTGKAPFEGPDVGIILQRVQSGRFPAPRVVKRQVPPGLEAICLKAMALKSQDRYSSPRALADDIEHWLADEPVAAYHEPLWARVARWIRHHQTLVSASTAAVVVAIIGGGVAAFLWERQHARQQAEQAHRDSQTRQAVALALAEVKSFQERARWEEARVTLQQAASRLVEGQAEDLHNQVEQAKRDLEIVARCDAISQKGAAMLREGLNFGAVDQDYAVAFQEAGLGTLSDAPSTVAERVRASAVRERLVAALDYWAMTAREPAHRRWVFDVVRLADPDPWRDQARDPAIWTNVAALVKLVRRNNALPSSCSRRRVPTIARS